MTESDKTMILEALGELTDKINDARVAAAETGTNVKTLMRSVNGIEEKMDTWENGGCPFGRINHVKLDNHERDISQTKRDIEKLKNGKRDQVLLGMGSGGVGAWAATFIGQLLASIFGKP